MSTASCLKQKFEEEMQRKKIVTKPDNSKLNCDASMNLLKKENEKLLKYIEDNYNKNFLDDKLLTKPAVSVYYVSVIYSIIFVIIGIFYNSLLSSSVTKILNEDVILMDFLRIENSMNYNSIWIKLESCLNNFRFYLFILTYLITLLINVGIIYVIILKGKNIKNAIKVVSLLSIAIIGITNLLTNNVSFVKIFENTIGYGLTSLISPKKDHSLTEFMNSLFSHDLFGKGGIDFTFLFTAFRLDNLGDLIRDIGTKAPESKYDFFIKAENGLNTALNNDLNILANAVVMKNSIGYIMWTLFASITSSIVSIKYLSREL